MTSDEWDEHEARFKGKYFEEPVAEAPEPDEDEVREYNLREGIASLASDAASQVLEQAVALAKGYRLTHFEVQEASKVFAEEMAKMFAIYLDELDAAAKAQREVPASGKVPVLFPGCDRGVLVETVAKRLAPDDLEGRLALSVLAEAAQ